MGRGRGGDDRWTVEKRTCLSAPMFVRLSVVTCRPNRTDAAWTVIWAETGTSSSGDARWTVQKRTCLSAPMFVRLSVVTCRSNRTDAAWTIQKRARPLRQAQAPMFIRLCVVTSHLNESFAGPIPPSWVWGSQGPRVVWSPGSRVLGSQGSGSTGSGV